MFRQPRNVSWTLVGAFLLAPVCSVWAGGFIDSLGWLSGCWREDTENGYFEEYWTPPAGATLLHMGRMVVNGKTVFYETLQISERDGRFGLLVTINGKRQVSFEAVESASRKIVFQTPAGVPLEKLSYEAPSENELYVRLEKTRDGQPTLDEFRLKRVDCRQALSGGRAR